MPRRRPAAARCGHGVRRVSRGAGGDECDEGDEGGGRVTDLTQAAAQPLLKVRDLVKSFPVRSSGFRGGRGLVHAVAGVSFDLHQGQTLSLVGESGCGKSTTARCVVRILDPTSGQVEFDGVDLGTLDAAALRSARSKFQMVFQDPQASLNPRMTVGEILAEPLKIHHIPGAEGRERIRELMSLVQLRSADLDRYPHQFSGGQRQRIGIVRALVLEPKLIALDEPVSALDVSIQAEIIRLLERLRDQLGLSYLFIAHDLSVVRHLSEHVAVMYLGKIVESGTNDEVYEQSAHPYTQALLAAAPIPDPLIERSRDRIVLAGDPPSPIDPPSGCHFRTRCWKAQDRCAEEAPVLADPGIGHLVACHFPEVSNVIVQQPVDFRRPT
ncbi:MAG: ATP-binding cassette domain-containing protein [Actinobacteria bacterium]|nr:ATP-binding cassette domain-containing protein [Actinomycetota bacterium]